MTSREVSREALNHFSEVLPAGLRTNQWRINRLLTRTVRSFGKGIRFGGIAARMHHRDAAEREILLQAGKKTMPGKAEQAS